MNRVRQNPWAIAAVVLLPVLVLGMLLAALWNPMDRLDTVQAAIVNNDEPVEVDGQTAPLGRQLAAGLVGGSEDSDVNYDWTLTDAQHAADGLADGTYAAVVTIPEEFSAAATSFGDAADARQATIDISTPAGGRVVDDALARIVGTTATSVMGSTLTETYVDNVLIGFGDLSEGIGEAADGAHQLADGADDAADGADELADGAGQLADGAGEYADGVGQAADGADQLADGVNQYAAGVSEAAGGTGALVDGAEQLAAGVEGVSGGIRASADGADDLAAGGYELADGADEIAAGVRELADQAALIDTEVPSAGELQAGLDEIAAQFEANQESVAGALAQASAALGCDADPTSEACEQLAGVGEALSSVSPDVTGEFDALSEQILAGRGQLDELAAGTQQLAGGAEGIATGTRGIADGNADLADGLGELADGNDQVAAGAAGLAGGVDQLADGLDQLDSGAQGLATGASGLASGFGPLQTGATELATGMTGIADGTVGLADGVDQLATGTDDLAGGLDEAVEGIPTYSESERQNLSSVVANPVGAPGVDDLSTGAAGPMFAVVALWLGALALLTIFPPVVSHALGSTRSALRLAFAAGAVPAAIGAGTGALVGGILAGVEGLSVGGWFATIAVGALVSVTFVAVHLGFVAWFGNVGRAISLLLAVLVIATGVVATVPDVLVSVAGFLPTGVGQDALSAVVVPGVGGAGAAVAMLVLWALVGLGLGVGAAARARRTRVATLLRG